MVLRWFNGERFWLNRVKSVELDGDQLTRGELADRDATLKKLRADLRRSQQFVREAGGGGSGAVGVALRMEESIVRGLQREMEESHTQNEARVRAEIQESKLQLQSDLRDDLDDLSEGGPDAYYVTVPIVDHRTGLDEQLNSEALGLEDLNDGSCSSCLLTTFDLPSVRWLIGELKLGDAQVTLCSHPWPNLPNPAEERAAVWEELGTLPGAVLHFPGSPQLSQPGAARKADEPVEETCSVHSKLMLLQFPDRLRVVIASANLVERSWEMNGEVLWVQDFSPLPPHDAGRLKLLDWDFGRVLAHFVAQTLHEAPLHRRDDWLWHLSKYHLDSQVRLVASLPSESVAARAMPAGQHVLRLQLKELLEPDELSELSLQRSSSQPWHLEGLEGLQVELNETAVKALEAAEKLELKVQVGLAQVPLRELQELPKEDTEAGHVRVLLHGEVLLNDGPQTAVADFMTCLEVDYGLFALRRHLAHEVWGQCQERDYVAIAPHVSGMDEAWFRSLDECCGRVALEAGPKVVVGPRPRIECSWMDNREERLVRHSSPAHSPGRDQIPNHSKILTRIFEGEAGSYGWVYLGSHNLTVAAWGSVTRYERDSVLSVCNRELGVLLIEPPETRSGLISRMALPFGFPLQKAELDEDDFTGDEASPPDEGRWEAGWTWDGWEGDSWSWNDWTWSEEEWQPDWRLQRGHWWWWA